MDQMKIDILRAALCRVRPVDIDDEESMTPNPYEASLLSGEDPEETDELP